MKWCRLFCFMAVAFVWGCGGETGTGDKPKQNQAPQVTKVRIQPDNPSSTQDLYAVVSGGDPDGDYVRYTFQWQINGQLLRDEGRSKLGSENIKRGDLVLVWVTPNDDQSSGDAVASPEMEILNSPPSISSVEIMPEVALPDDEVEAVAEVNDSDDDSVAIRYLWIVNGEASEETSSNLFSTQGLKRGDRLVVRATPEDSDSQGEPASSAEVSLQNRPPTIASQPPGNLVATGKYRYPVKAEDRDGDPLQFRLEGSPPEGMRIDAKTGLLEWAFSEVPEETIFVDIRVSDGQGGEAKQSYDFTVPGSESES
jgi:hypothetical protein